MFGVSGEMKEGGAWVGEWNCGCFAGPFVLNEQRFGLDRLCVN